MRWWERLDLINDIEADLNNGTEVPDLSEVNSSIPVSLWFSFDVCF